MVTHSLSWLLTSLRVRELAMGPRLLFGQLFGKLHLAAPPRHRDCDLTSAGVLPS